MHTVIWTSKGQQYATPSSSIVEVIPMVRARPVAGSPAWLIGLFDFRGDLTPLIDSSRLLGYGESNVRMASRILVIRTSAAADSDGDRVGLAVEQVIGSEHLDFDQKAGFQPSSASGTDFLGPVAVTSDSTVQLTIPSRLPSGRD